MKKITLLVPVYLICILYTNLFAQVDTLSVADTSGSPGSTNNPLNIELNNTVGVAGVQFTLTFDGSLLAATSVSMATRTSHMSIGYSSWVDSVKILMYSMTGDSISPGKGPIIGILFDVDSSAVAGDSTLLHLKDVTLSDPHAQSISVNIVDGWFHFVTPVGIEENQPGDKMPPVFRLHQNSPNPFVFATSIRYQLPIESKVSLKIYSCTGQLVRTLENTKKGPGYYIVNWKGYNDKDSKVASGIYFCKLEAHADPVTYTGRETGDYKAIKKMILLR